MSNNFNHFIIRKNEHGYAAWPTVRRLANNELVVVFCEALRRSTKKAPVTYVHRDPTFYMYITRSRDNGMTWDEPQLIGGYEYYGVDDPGIAQLNDGTILVNTYIFPYIPAWKLRQKGFEGYFQIKSRLKNYPWATCYPPDGTLIFRSADNGQTWATPDKINAEPFGCGCTLRPIIELPDGELILGCYDVGDMKTLPTRAFIMRSKDKGHTWNRATLIAAHDRIGFAEPALALMPDGKIIALLRTAEGTKDRRELYQCFSSDGGQTWSKAVPTALAGYPADVQVLRDGRLLCLYARRWEPRGIFACLSLDHGKTWQTGHELVIRADFTNGDMGYPTFAELTDGNIFVSYYGHDQDGVNCIRGTVLNNKVFNQTKEANRE